MPWKQGEPKEKVFEGKTYVPCPFHDRTKWVLKEGHAHGCRFDLNFKGDKMPPDKKSPKEKKPSKKALQLASALVHAMEVEEKGQLSDDESSQDE